MTRPVQHTAAAVAQWLREGKRVVAGLLVEVEGSSPLDVGASMYISEDGGIEGSITGGCVEGAVAAVAMEMLAERDPAPQLQTYGISDELAGTVGLMCGGIVHIFIHELQPGALVGNNHHVRPFPGEDFQMFEQDLPGENTADFNKAEVSDTLPLETCLTMNKSWGYNARDTAFKSPEQILHYLLKAAGRGAKPALSRRTRSSRTPASPRRGRGRGARRRSCGSGWCGRPVSSCLTDYHSIT